MENFDLIYIVLFLVIIDLFSGYIKLAHLQQKDYMIKRVLAEPSSLIPRIVTEKIAVAAIILAAVFITPNEINLGILILIKLFLIIFIYGILIFKRVVSVPKPTFRGLFLIFVKTFIGTIGVLVCFGLALITTNAPLNTQTLMFIVAFMLATQPIRTILASELIKPIIYRQHRRVIAKASELLKDDNNIIKIGITGSFGKTSIKYFLNAILKEEFKIISTDRSINTDIGLAQQIIEEVSSNPDKSDKHSHAVLEMDAYLEGTIARIVNAFPLNIVILTGLNNQHLATFDGKIEKISKANYEVFNNLEYRDKLVAGGVVNEPIAIINAENEKALELAVKLSKDKPDTQILYYGYEENLVKRNLKGVGVKNLKKVINPGSTKLVFQLVFANKITENQTLDVEMNVNGDFNALNFAAAALAALSSGTSVNSVINAAAKVQLQPRSQKTAYSDGIEIIDDSYNANLDGVLGNLENLKLRQSILPAKFNVVLFSGLYDLGRESRLTHQKLAQKFVNIASKTIITHTRFGNEVLSSKELNNPEKEQFSVTRDLKEIKQIINEYNSNNTLDASNKVNLRILIAGRIPADIYNYIKTLIL